MLSFLIPTHETFKLLIFPKDSTQLIGELVTVMKKNHLGSNQKVKCGGLMRGLHFDSVLGVEHVICRVPSVFLSKVDRLS